jgi:hypothetical protein
MIWTTEPFGPGLKSLELCDRIQGLSGRLKVIKTKKQKKRIMETVKNRNNRKIDFHPFSIVSYCQPIRSNQRRRQAFYGLYVRISHGCVGGGGANHNPNRNLNPNSSSTHARQVGDNRFDIRLKV